MNNSEDEVRERSEREGQGIHSQSLDMGYGRSLFLEEHLQAKQIKQWQRNGA